MFQRHLFAVFKISFKSMSKLKSLDECAVTVSLKCMYCIFAYVWREINQTSVINLVFPVPQ